MARMEFEVNERGCHIWTRAVTSQGYGAVWHEGKVHLTHRVAFLLDRGRWPAKDLVIDHICNTKLCVNPEHLRELQNWKNLRRAVAKGSPEQELKRARWRKSDAKRRGNYTYVPGGEEDRLVQSG